MSKATSQAIGLLSVISGCMKTIYEFKLAPDHEAAILYTWETVDALIIEYPITGNGYKMKEWVIKKTSEFEELLFSLVTEKFNAPLLTAMSIHVCIDLERKIKDRKKLDIIEPVHEAVIGLNELLDPKGYFEKEFHRAEEVAKMAYKIFEFIPKKD